MINGPEVGFINPDRLFHKSFRPNKLSLRNQNHHYFRSFVWDLRSFVSQYCQIVWNNEQSIWKGACHFHLICAVLYQNIWISQTETNSHSYEINDIPFFMKLTQIIWSSNCFIISDRLFDQNRTQWCASNNSSSSHRVDGWDMTTMKKTRSLTMFK